MGRESIIDKMVCGVCLNHTNDIEYYFCSIAPICKGCLSQFLSTKNNVACPLCPPIKNCSFRIVNYDITTYTSPSQS